MKNLDYFFEAQGKSVLSGAPDGLDIQAVAALADQSGKAHLHIVTDDKAAEFTAQLAAFFAPNIEILTFPAWDCLPYDRVSPQADIIARRLSVLKRLLDLGDKPYILITTAAAVLQRLPPRASLVRQKMQIKPGQRLDLDAFLGFLTDSGFNRVETVMEAGDYAVRGSIIDIFPADAPNPARIDLFDEEVESIKHFDALSQRSEDSLAQLTLGRVGEISLDKDGIAKFRAGYREQFGVPSSDDALYQAISEGSHFQGAEHWLPLFHDRLESLLDYCPHASITLQNHASTALETRHEMIMDHFESREIAMESGDSSYQALPPAMLYLTVPEFDDMCSDRHRADFALLRPADSNDGRVVDLGGRKGRGFGDLRSKADGTLFTAVREHLTAANKAENRTVIVAGYSNGSLERLKALIEGGSKFKTNLVTAFEQAARKRAVSMAVLPLEHGFESPDLVIVTEQDILGERLTGRRKKSRKADNFIREASTLSPGDHVVHIDHGIGKYEGLQTVDAGGAPHDCLLLSYAGGDRLYIPVENLDMLSRYGSEDTAVQLDKLGGAAWQQRRAKMKKRLKDMADELLKVAAARHIKSASRLAAPSALYEEFCARFPFEETEDQARAINDTLHDLDKGRPMDRLVCGDVGFGKTEVALRAAFQAVMSGKQVAIVAPTTLLARQHFNTFSKRFKDLPVNVCQVSRLVTGKALKEVKEGIKQGGVDIAVGTHALLGAGIDFNRLGLLIIDEEQHFGVRHKERLKQLKSDVHVLTLSATPIPRTLQLALTGVKELSLIATPPVDRLAVRTFVTPQDDVVLRDAIMREKYRGGQIYYVCPRVSDLADLEKKLKELVPECKTRAAHGRLSAGDLDTVMNDFYDRNFDILLATNIVESGLDVSTANTIIIHRADMFGLAQLYQLRGRIGRSKLRGYCYLTLPRGKKINKVAEKRLHVLQTLDSLGAGFSLASHDLDLRGAGNLLGEEQSGHVREVGFELYQDMLEEAINEARLLAEGGSSDLMPDEKWSPQINMGAAVLIPESYVPDLGVRMSLYKRLAWLEEADDLEGFAAELIDRFGKMPEEVEHLLAVVGIKQACRKAGVERVDAGPKGAVVAFRGNKFANPLGLVQFIASEGPKAQLRPDHKLVAKRMMATAQARLSGVRELVDHLATIAVAEGG